MGKIKRERQKYHISTEPKNNTNASSNQFLKYKPLQLDAVENIFAGINIQLDDSASFSEPVQNVVNVNQAEIGETSTKIPLRKNDIGIKPRKHLKKKEKLVLKHQKLIKKLDVMIEKNQKRISKEVIPLLTPAALKPSTQQSEVKEKVPRNVFAIPAFNDDLPTLNSVFEHKFNSNKKNLSSKSKTATKQIAKKHFVHNYNFLKKAMDKKKK